MSRVLRLAVCEWCNCEMVNQHGRFCTRLCASNSKFSKRGEVSKRQRVRDRRASHAIRGRARVRRPSVDPVRVRGAVIARFKSKIAMPNSNGCRLWTAGRSPSGYGLFQSNGRCNRAHRFAWELANGAIPSGMLVCHTCDVPACCEITHLWLGTNADNMRDMVEKGRACSGDRNRAAHPPMRGVLNGNARLVEADIRFIRESVEAGVCRKELAEKYGVGLQQICSIVVRRSWKHVQ